ncbi:MAG: alpha/beta fold hydrolase [Piscirickettsiaceae bacterium]|nr:alpha/beta fold hydrolase [Piscirickettsiaceae bacterium]
MKLHHKIIGSPSEQPLVILHGLFGSLDNWRVLAKQFSQSVQVITVDLRNHGRSPHSNEQNYQLMADDLAELLDDLGLKEIDLIGHSVGGKVAMAFSDYYVERLRKLLVVDVAPREYADEHSDIFEMLLALDLANVTARSELDTQLAEFLPNKAIRQFLLMNIVADNNGLKWRINLKALADTYPFLLQAVCDDETINIPTLFIRGGRSHYIKQSDDMLIKRTFPNSDIVTIEQAGHWVHADASNEFMQISKEFFEYA